MVAKMAALRSLNRDWVSSPPLRLRQLLRNEAL